MTIGDSVSLVLRLRPASGEDGDSFPTIMEVDISTCLLTKPTAPKRKRERWEGSLAKCSTPGTTPSSKSVKITTLTSGRAPPARLRTNALPAMMLSVTVGPGSLSKLTVPTLPKDRRMRKLWLAPWLRSPVLYGPWWVAGCVCWRLRSTFSLIGMFRAAFCFHPNLDP